MRLIHTKTLQIQEFVDEDEIPPYAILSHRWGSEEVTLQQMENPDATSKAGYDKIRRGCELALEAGISHFWADTCCIDKTSSAELSEAINSMYRWYKNAKVCYAYLADVEHEHDLETSAWFTRGWTLQELLAPADVFFFNNQWEFIGEKRALSDRIGKKTGIPALVLKAESIRCSVAERMSWAAKRVTTRKEDMAYSLMGLFDVNMPLLYGEGGEKAFIRLQEEIIRKVEEMSIFSWTCPKLFSDFNTGRGLLAPSVSCFEHCGDVRIPGGLPDDGEEITVTNRGISVCLRLQAFAFDVYAASLSCMIGSEVVCVFLSRTTEIEQQFTRVLVKGQDRIYLPYETIFSNHWVQPRRLRVPSKGSLPLQMLRFDCRDVVLASYSSKAPVENHDWGMPSEVLHLPANFTSGNKSIGNVPNKNSFFPFHRILVGVDLHLNLVLVFTTSLRAIYKFDWSHVTAVEDDKLVETDWQEHGMCIISTRYEGRVKPLNLTMRCRYENTTYLRDRDKTLGPTLVCNFFPIDTHQRWRHAKISG